MDASSEIKSTGRKARSKSYKRKRSRITQYGGSKERLRLKCQELQTSAQEAAALLKDKESEFKKQNILIKR
jgi:hypothetical protein